MIILDSTPLLVVNDAVALSSEVDGVLMVMRSERIKRKLALQGKEKLESVNATFIGAVLNDVDYSKQYGYYYHRYYRYYNSYHKDDGE